MMCGFCTEQLVFDVLKREIRNDPPSLSDSLMAEFYLQEASAPLSALERIARDLPQSQHDPHQIVAPETLLCKAIELLVEGGFDSPEYQNFLGSPRFRDTLAEACSDEQRKKLQSVAEKFGVDRLEILYEESIFTTADGTKRLQAIAYLKDEALDCCSSTSAGG